MRAFTPSGTLVGPVTAAASSCDFVWPSGPATDSEGNVYVADAFNDGVAKISPGGTVLATFGAGQLSDPSDVAVDPEGDAFVSRAFSGSFVATKSSQGKISGLCETGARQPGTFNVRGVGRGRWYALFDVTADPLKLTARATGKLLALRKGRDACLSFVVDVGNGAVSGRFSGGARGTFRQKIGPGNAWKVTGSGSPGRSSTTACRALRRAFKLR